MGQIGEQHRKIINGKGLCSVPMWAGMGYPAGFCDKPAFGERPPGKEWRNAYTGKTQRWDGKYSGYVPALACKGHGGPSLEEYVKDKTIVRFDGPPDHEAGRFVEVECNGKSINFGEWIEDGDHWLLVLPGADQ